MMQGTLDDTAFAAVPTALRFVESVGGAAAVFDYNHG
jgi:hypothetical protein